MTRKRNKKSPREQAEKLTFTLAPRYAEKVYEMSSAAGINPNQFGRIATMIVAQNGLLHHGERLERIEDNLIRLLRDFNAAIYDEAA